MSIGPAPRAFTRRALQQFLCQTNYGARRKQRCLCVSPLSTALYTIKNHHDVGGSWLAMIIAPDQTWLWSTLARKSKPKSLFPSRISRLDLKLRWCQIAWSGCMFCIISKMNSYTTWVQASRWICDKGTEGRRNSHTNTLMIAQGFLT